MGRPRRDMAPIYQALAAGECVKRLADTLNITPQAVSTALMRHRRMIGVATHAQAMAIMTGRGVGIGRA